MRYLLDTNVLMDFPYVLEELSNIVISIDVLKELDGLKLNINPDTSFKARRAAVCISRNIDRITWLDYLDKVNKSVDDKLIEYIKKDEEDDELVLVTNDVYLKIKCLVEGIKTIPFGGGEDYSGITYWDIDCDENGYNKELQNAIEQHEKPLCLNLLENEYVIARNKNSIVTLPNGKTSYEFLHAFVYRNEELKPLSNNSNKNPIKNNCIDKIFPKNEEQLCLFDILFNRGVSIVYAGGIFGSGKSFILNNFALQELENQNIKKIVYIPNNSYTENTMDIGALPGELLSKTIGQIGPLVDLVGIDEINKMIGLEQLEVVPMGFVRGRSFQDSIIIVNEAQNLTEDHIKLLIARCGEGTRIFFDGDYKQTDSQIFRNKNGLKLLLNLRKSPYFSKIFGTVKLTKTERSFTAQAADYLDEITGKI